MKIISSLFIWTKYGNLYVVDFPREPVYPSFLSHIYISTSLSTWLGIFPPHLLTSYLLSFFLMAERWKSVFMFFFFLFSEKLTAELFCWFSKALDLSEKPQLRLYKMKHRTTPGNRKVFSIITYYVCLENQKHLQQIWLKEPPKHS